MGEVHLVMGLVGIEDEHSTPLSAFGEKAAADLLAEKYNQHRKAVPKINDLESRAAWDAYNAAYATWIAASPLDNNADYFDSFYVLSLPFQPAGDHHE